MKFYLSSGRVRVGLFGLIIVAPFYLAALAIAAVARLVAALARR